MFLDLSWIFELELEWVFSMARFEIGVKYFLFVQQDLHFFVVLRVFLWIPILKTHTNIVNNERSPGMTRKAWEASLTRVPGLSLQRRLQTPAILDLENRLHLVALMLFSTSDPSYSGDIVRLVLESCLNVKEESVFVMFSYFLCFLHPLAIFCCQVILCFNLFVRYLVFYFPSSVVYAKPVYKSVLCVWCRKLCVPDDRL